MKKMVNDNQMEVRRSLQSIEKPEPLFEKV